MSDYGTQIAVRPARAARAVLSAVALFAAFAFATDAHAAGSGRSPNPPGFLPQPKTLTVSKSGQGTVRGFNLQTTLPVGINCGSDCTENFLFPFQIRLTATPATGFIFARWQPRGDCQGGGDCVVTMTENRTAHAIFVPRTYPLRVTRSGEGTVTLDPPSDLSCAGEICGLYRHGTEVKLRATPASGWRFGGFSGGGCSGAGLDCSVTMAQARAVTATFVRVYPVQVALAGNGAGVVNLLQLGFPCRTQCTRLVDAGTALTLEALPDPGSDFLGFAGSCATALSRCTMTVDAPKQVVATFQTTPGRFALEVEVAGTGTGRVTSTPAGISCRDDCSETYPAATEVTLTAEPTAGSTFAGFTGACSGQTLTCRVTMDERRAVVATFNAPAQNQTLTVTTEGSGTGRVTSLPAGIDCAPDCARGFAPGTSVALTATAAPGSTFTGFSGACTGQTCNVAMSEARSVTATFVLTPPATHPVTVTTTGSGSGIVTSQPAGIVCPPECSAAFPAGATVTLTAAATAGSRFVGFSGACSGQTCTLTADAAKQVTAEFDSVGQGQAATQPGGGNQPGAGKRRAAKDKSVAVLLERVSFRKRSLRARIAAGERLRVELRLVRRGKLLTRKRLARFAVGRRTVALAVPRKAGGAARLQVVFRDRAGNVMRVSRAVRIPRAA